MSESPSIHLPNTRTAPQQDPPMRQAIPIPKSRSRNHQTNFHRDYHDPCDIDNSDEFDQSHPTRKSQSTKCYTSQLIGLEVGDEEEVMGGHSIPKQEDNNCSTSARTNTITTFSSTRASRNSHVRQTASASPDATRLRHVPRGPVARVRPTTPPTKSSRSQSLQNTLGHSQSISDALMTGTDCSILGIGVDVIPCTGQHDGAEQVAGPRCSTSPAVKSRSPHGTSSSAPIRRMASPPRDINKPPICSTDLCSSVSTGSMDFDISATAGSSRVEQSSKRSAGKVRSIVRPLPALPGEMLNGTGSASKASGAGIEQSVRDLSPPPSLTLPNDSLTPKMDANTHSTNTIRRAPTNLRSTAFNSKLRCTPQVTSRMITIDKDQSEDDTPTPTVPFPTPRRSLTTGMVPLSRDTKPPPLFIPPLNRCLSFKGITEGARLSPSVIIRPPPLPLINLPVLPTTNRANAAGAEGSEGGTGEDERRRSRLMRSMPALPLQGSSRGARGLEEVDDLDEEDEEEEGEEDDEGNEVSGRSSASSSSRIETPRSSFDSQTSLDEADEDDLVEELSATSHSSQTLSSLSSYETARAEPSPSFGESHRWDTDPIGVVKGKAKQELGDDEGIVGSVVSPTMKGLARLSKPRGRGDRGVEVQSGLKVVATRPTPDVKVARLERLVPERVGSGSGSAGRTRLKSNKPSSSKGKNVVPPRHPLPPEPLRAAESSTLPVKGTILGIPRLGDRAMRSKTVSTTPVGSPMLDERSLLGSGLQNKMYKRASTSLIDVRAIGKKERIERMIRDQEEEEDRKRSSRVLKVSVSSRKGNKDMVSQDVVSQDEGKRLGVEESSVGHSEPKSLNLGSSGQRTEKTTVTDGATSGKTTHSQESSIHPLRRRRSMPTSNPPSYSSLFAGIPPGLGIELKVQPREDEGKENLPPYTNDIFLKAIMPRKMEFTSPGIQAKDRKWRHVLCVLDGTVLRVYKCSPSGGVSAWWEHKVGAGDPLMDAVPGGRSATPNSASRADDRQEPGCALAREIELARAKKSGEAGEAVQPLLRINNSPVDRSQQLRSYSPLPKPHGQHQSSGSHGVTKSALTFAAQLLKPSVTKHSRSNSEAPPVSEPSTSSSRSRTSMSLPRRGTDGSDSVQSQLPATVSTHLTIPSNRSRPLSPASNGRPDETKTSQSSSFGSKKKAEQGAELGDNDLIRVYTMQHAESGLGKDYTKRQHVIRVRLEGEQFLLQAKNVESVIAWIEGLQCAANVALDLDERPMPAGAMLPRRRRRRRTAAAAVASSTS